MSPLSWNVAVKFLMARKFDVLRAIELFHSYRVSERAGTPQPRASCSVGDPCSLEPPSPCSFFFFSLTSFIQLENPFPAKAGRHGDLVDPNPFPSSGAAHGVPSWLVCAAHRAFPYVLRI